MHIRNKTQKYSHLDFSIKEGRQDLDFLYVTTHRESGDIDTITLTRDDRVYIPSTKIKLSFGDIDNIKSVRTKTFIICNVNTAGEVVELSLVLDRGE